MNRHAPEFAGDRSRILRQVFGREREVSPHFNPLDGALYGGVMGHALRVIGLREVAELD
jgi:hypothetical protein